MRRSDTPFATTVSALFLMAVVRTAWGQAWLPPQGEAFISFGYGNAFITEHYLGTPADPGDNVPTNRGHIRSQSFGVELGYAITNRLAVSVGLPYVEAKWYPFEGLGKPHVALDGTTIDDGQYHGTFQDYRAEALYQVALDPVALTPFVGVVIPSHGYRYFAHAAAGRDLREYLVGVNLGGRLDLVVPGSYAQAKYSYAFVESVFVETVGKIHHDRSNLFLELGYFVRPSLAVRFLASGFYTHGGLAFSQPADYGTPQDATNPVFLHHDQIGHDSALSLGGGVSYALTGSVDVYASYLRTVTGHGGHKIDHGISIGASLGFSPQQVVRRLFGSRTSGLEKPAPP